jgi:hypothetical protein
MINVMLDKEKRKNSFHSSQRVSKRISILSFEIASTLLVKSNGQQRLYRLNIILKKVRFGWYYRYSNRHTPKGSARCVQKLDDSLDFAIRITYRISLRSSSMWEPRHPLLKVFLSFGFFFSLF